MRRTLSCVLMMTLLLTACSGKSGDDPQQLAAVIRGEYLSMNAWSTTAEISVTYGEQVFDFTVDAQWQKEAGTVLTITQPTLLAGITARIQPEETVLEYDGAGLSLGALDSEGLTPVSMLPAVMECVMKGYMARCSWLEEGEGRILVILCCDPDRGQGEGTEYTLYFDELTHAMLRAEVSVDGVLCLTAALTDFTMEMTKNESGTDEDLG